MIPFAKPQIGNGEYVPVGNRVDEYGAVQDVLFSGWLTQGPKVTEFESAFATRVNAPYALACSSGTTALHLALMQCVRPGDSVITSTHSFVASVNAILYCRAHPILVDIDSETLNLDLNAVRAVMESVTGENVRAILAVDQLGHPCDLVTLREICNTYNLSLVEDAACALGSKPVGNADFTCYSFHPRKIITTGEGGMVTTGSYGDLVEMQWRRSHGAHISDRERHGSAVVLPETYPVLGYNYRMTDIQAAIGIEQLKRLDEFLVARRTIADHYNKALTGREDVCLFTQPPGTLWNHQTYMIYLPRANAATRDQFMQTLLDRGIHTRRGVTSIHRQSYFIERFGYQHFPISEQMSDQCVALPMFTEMTEGQVDEVVEAVKHFAP